MKRWTVGWVAVAMVGLNEVQGAIYSYSDYDWKTYNGHQYAITFDYNTWLGAEAEAEGVGGYLATVNNASENVWLTANFGGYYTPASADSTNSLVWIGLKGIPDSLAWANGDPVNYVASLYSGSWRQGIEGTGEYGYLHPSTHFAPGTWWNHDRSSMASEWWPRGIIELDQSPVPEPATLIIWSLLGVCGMGSGCWRRKRAA
jgi:hypothetical protein